MTSQGVQLNSNGDYWQVTWRDSRGTRRRQSLGAKAKINRKEATRRCKSIEFEHAQNPATLDLKGAPNLDVWLDKLQSLRTDWGHATRTEYASSGKRLLDYYGPIKISKISKLSVSEFRARLAESVSEQTVRKHIRNCKVIFKEACRLDIIAKNPFADEKSAPQKVAHRSDYISPKAFLPLLDHCPDDNWRLMFALARFAGLRRNEILSVRWQDIDWQKHQLAVNAEGTADTKHHERAVPIGSTLYQLLSDAAPDDRTGDTNIVTLTDSSSGHFYRQLHKIIEQSGAPAWRKPLHSLRAHCEIDWQKYGVMNAAKCIGHSAQVAADHYHSVTDDVMDQMAGLNEQRRQGEVDILRGRIKKLVSYARELKHNAPILPQNTK